MSLRIWLPFNGDTKDYSGNNIPVNTGNVTYNNNGKIGKCIDTGWVNLDARYAKEIFNTRYQSICFWHYNKDETSISRAHIITGPNGPRRYTLFIYPKSNDLHLSMAGTGGTYNTGHVISNCLPNLRWTHVCLVNDNMVIKTYVNGIIKDTRNVASDFADVEFSTYPLRVNSTISMMNDFRVYDHALSEKEVKEIAKAKILHYDFQNVNQPTRNLISNPDGKILTNSTPGAIRPGWDPLLHNDAIQVYDWFFGYNSGVPDPTVGYHSRWVYGGVDGPDDPCIYFQDENSKFGQKNRWLGTKQDVVSLVSLNLKPGDKLTYSYYQKSDVFKGCNAGIYYYSIYHQKYVFGDTMMTKIVKALDTWERVHKVVTITEDMDLSKSVTMYLYGYQGVEGKLWVDNIQLEVGPGPTAFVNGSIETGFVRDKSGFRNDGIIKQGTNPIIVDSDISGVGGNMKNYGIYEGNQHITVNESVKVSDEITINVFAYRDSWTNNTNNERMISCTEGGGWSLYITTVANNVTFENWVGGGYKYTNYLLSNLTNGWHMFTCIFDGYVSKLYVDGKLVNLQDHKFTTRQSIVYNPNNTVFIGSEATNNNHTPYGLQWNGLIGDTRIYATALSDTDVMEIYQDRLSIDNKGTVFVQSLNEQYKTYSRIEKYPDDYIHFSVYSKQYPTDSGIIHESSPNRNLAGVYTSSNELVWQYGRDWNIGVWDTYTNDWAKGINFYGATTYTGAHGLYDVWRPETRVAQSLAFCNTLKNLTDRYIVIIVGCHSPEFYTPEMVEQIKRCGGTDKNLKWKDRRSSYICIGRVGCGEGNALSEVLNNMDPINNISNSDSLPRSWAHTKAIFPKNDLSIKANGDLITEIVEDGIGITDGMVAWYPMGDDSRDYSVNGYHGEIIGDITRSNSNISGKLSYDFPKDAKSHIKIPNEVLDGLGDFTISGWYWFNDDSSHLHSIVSAMTSGVSNAFLYSFNVSGNSIATMDTWVDNTQSVVPVVIKNVVNNWTHITYRRTVIDSTKAILSIIANDEIISNGEYPLADTLRISGYSLIGQEQDTIGGGFDITQCMYGKIHDLRIYNRALSNEEVSVLYNTTSGNDIVKYGSNGKTYINGQIREI